MTPTASTQPQCVSIRNRANAQHSTGPRSDAGKQRSALNALTHGLTARTAVLPSEDSAAYEQHHRQLHDDAQVDKNARRSFVPVRTTAN
jgi:hypothetical protein